MFARACVIPFMLGAVQGASSGALGNFLSPNDLGTVPHCSEGGEPC